MAYLSLSSYLWLAPVAVDSFKCPVKANCLDMGDKYILNGCPKGEISNQILEEFINLKDLFGD